MMIPVFPCKPMTEKSLVKLNGVKRVHMDIICLNRKDINLAVVMIALQGNNMDRAYVNYKQRWNLARTAIKRFAKDVSR